MIWTRVVSFLLSLLEIASFPSGESSDNLQHKYQHKHSDFDARDRNFNRQTLREGINGQVFNYQGPGGSSGVRSRMPVLPLLRHSLDRKNVGHFYNHTHEYHKQMGSVGEGIKMLGDSNCSEVLRNLRDISDRGLCDSESVEDLDTVNDTGSFHNKDGLERLEKDGSYENLVQWNIPQKSFNYTIGPPQAMCKGYQLLCYLTRAATYSKKYKLGNVNDWIIDNKINNTRSFVSRDFNGNSYEAEINMNLPSAKEDIVNKGDINKQITSKRFRKFQFPLQPNIHSSQQVTDPPFFQFSSQSNPKLSKAGISGHLYKHVHSNMGNLTSHIKTDSDGFVDIDNLNSESNGKRTLSQFVNSIRSADTVVNVEIPYGMRNLKTLISSPLTELDKPSMVSFSIQGFGSNPPPNSLPRTHNHSHSTLFQTLHTNISFLSSTNPFIIQPFSVTSTSFILVPSASILSLDILTSSTPLTSSSSTMTSTSLLSPSFVDSTPTSPSRQLPQLTPPGSHLNNDIIPPLRTASYFISQNSLSLSPFSSLPSTADPDYDDGHERECKDGACDGDKQNESILFADLEDDDFPARERRHFDVGEVPDQVDNSDLHKDDTFELSLFLLPPHADKPPGRVSSRSSSVRKFDSFPTKQITRVIRPTSVLAGAILVSNPPTPRRGQQQSPPRVLYETPIEQSPATPYQFSYEVYNTENQYGHQEERTGTTVTGTYHVILPNGLRQIVSYYADETGYHPTISYQRINDFDPRSFPF